MKRALAIVAVLAAAVIIAVVVWSAADSGSGGYKVRAIFDSAFSVIPGEDVKVAGVKVGTIDSLSVTSDKKAAVVLDITKPGFDDWRQDAVCIIRPQSLIGEQFVECTPTEPRGEDEQAPPPLKKIDSGPGKGQYLLPVTNTRHNVSLDLINNIYQLPERQRLTIILNELGTGLAGRGADLNDVIRRADPALMETDKVLDILKQQNQVLADLAEESDRVLQPLAEKRQQVADFITRAKNVNQTTAEHRGALEQNFERLPAFLAQLRPTLVQLGDLSDQMTPVLTDLDAQSNNINTLIQRLGPLAEAGRQSFPSLGRASEVGTQAMRTIRPITRDVNNLSTSLAPLASDLNDILVSLRDTGGIERAMDYLFFQMTAINGFDSAGHYLRAGLLLNTCSTYAIEKTIGCEATFTKAGAALRADAGAGIGKRALKGGKAGRSTDADAGSGDQPISMPSAVLPGSTPVPTPTPSSGAPATAPDPATTTSTTTTTTPTTTAPPAESAPASSGSGAPAVDATGRLLDYLLGGGQ
jgi:ABC-type transporter Mla subunit MlaD